MNRIILPLLVAGGLALAQGQEAPPSLTLEAAFQIAPDASAALIAARTEVAAAQRDLDRTLADPLALRVPRLQAEQRLASAREALDAGLIALRITVARAYFAALEADEALEIARLEHAIAQVSLEAQQVRFNAGAATQLDLDRAGNDLDTAVRTLAETGSDRELAYAELASQLGTAVTSLGPLATRPRSSPNLAGWWPRPRPGTAGSGRPSARSNSPRPSSTRSTTPSAPGPISRAPATDSPTPSAI